MSFSDENGFEVGDVVRTINIIFVAPFKTRKEIGSVGFISKISECGSEKEYSVEFVGSCGKVKATDIELVEKQGFKFLSVGDTVITICSFPDVYSRGSVGEIVKVDKGKFHYWIKTPDYKYGNQETRAADVQLYSEFIKERDMKMEVAKKQKFFIEHITDLLDKSLRQSEKVVSVDIKFDNGIILNVKQDAVVKEEEVNNG